MTQGTPGTRPRRSRRRRPAAQAAGPVVSEAATSPVTVDGPAATDGPAADLATRFSDLGLPAELLAELTRQGVTVPFPIQAATLPSSLAGRDVLGRGRTGSGKTLAFGLAMLTRTAGRSAESRRPLALVLVPTRELAQQVTDALSPYARVLRLRIATVVGGLSLNRQAGELRSGAEIVVATPGRLRDLVDRGDCRLDRIALTVLDEADQMADLGFLPQVTALLRLVPADGQRLLFSATLDDNVNTLVRRFMSDPVVHAVDPSAGAVTAMEHHVLHISDDDKHDTVVRIAARDGRVLLFLDSKRAADRLTKKLLASGVRAAALHGGKSQSQRNGVLARFKTGEVSALVATNVAARGIHIDDLDLVVNIDPPADHKDYLHRGGRTARAGASGSVVTLVLPGQRRDMDRLAAKAGIRPRVTRVRPADPELSRITGAREPSGVPILTPPPAAAPRSAKKPASSAGRRRTGATKASGTRSGTNAAPTRRATQPTRGNAATRTRRRAA
jgi:superfamily II DNA/RNA helicase